MTTDLNRRGVLRALGCCAGGPAVAALTATGAATGAWAQSGEQADAPAPPPAPAPAPAGLTPDEALDLLKAGNTEFITDVPFHGAENRRRRLEIAQAQHPFAVLAFAVLVGCSDSRGPPELLFGRGLGELFVVRVAVTTVDLTAPGSIECAMPELAVPLVVVLGHERHGAVAAAVELVETNATFPGRIGTWSNRSFRPCWRCATSRAISSTTPCAPTCAASRPSSGSPVRPSPGWSSNQAQDRGRALRPGGRPGRGPRRVRAPHRAWPPGLAASIEESSPAVADAGRNGCSVGRLSDPTEGRGA